jgi:DNA-binding beta-propeller fold protein YncE
MARRALILGIPVAIAVAGVVTSVRSHDSPTPAPVPPVAPVVTAVAAVASDVPDPVSTGTLGDPIAIPSPLPEDSVPRAVTGDPVPMAPAGSSYRRVFGRRGMNPGEFAYPRAIVCGADGWVYVVDKRGRIQAFDPDLRVRAITKTPQSIVGAPTGLAMASNGKLLVADTHYARVLTYSKELVLESGWGRPGSRDGGFLYLADAREAPGGLFVTLDYFNDMARLQIWRQGELVKRIGRFGDGPREFKRPMALALDEKHGELWIADSENNRIQVLRWPDCALLRTLGGLGQEPGKLKFPYDISIDEDGRAWVAEFGNHRLQVLDRDGKSLAIWGSPGRELGELGEPWGVALAPNGLAYVLDSANERVYELERSRVLEGGRGGSTGR